MNPLLIQRLVTPLAGAICFLVTTLVLLEPGRVARQIGALPRETGAVVDGPSWHFVNPELDQLMAELRSEKELLARKEHQLQELAARLQAERAEINQITQLVHRMQVELDKNIVTIKEEETANLKKLAKVYTAMTPEGAATIVRELPDEMIVKIFSFMKEAETAAILESLGKGGTNDARRAADITDQLRLTRVRSATGNTPRP
ncbi:hypothetical protein NXS98_10860 [Fontisphaera persica]|uniref:MotE family protein n=1 Tax=Fontisphaera persica TaxID=2974023 RepID=UPI0024C06B03|nr:hypothetical protein [Fontisphaera persica]WCJ58225.1 hypothetical protein NXS98_10860 [Fontisphaera persica]